MKITTLNHFPTAALKKDSALCLGFFDGFHLGHQELLKKAKEKANDIAVMTFDVSPSIFLHKKEDNHILMTLEDKISFLEKENIDELFIIPFSQEVADLSKEDFIEHYLKVLSPDYLVVGSDYSFGKYGSGKVVDLKASFSVIEVPLLEIGNSKVSSRGIIAAIEEGKVEKASELLGRPYSLKGKVVEGKHNGRTISFPTANLITDPHLVIPKLGVYDGYALYQGRRYKTIISVSTHPTIMELSHPIIEAYLLDFDQDIYHEELTLEFIRYVRGIYKFSSMEELKAQLEKDKKECAELLPNKS